MSINNIEITDVIIFPVRKKTLPTPQKEENLIAFARMVLNDIFIVSGIKIYKSRNGRFVKMPSELSKQAKKSYDICFPITWEFRNYMNNEILKQAKIAMPTNENEEG